MFNKKQARVKQQQLNQFVLTGRGRDWLGGGRREKDAVEESQTTTND